MTHWPLTMLMVIFTILMIAMVIANVYAVADCNERGGKAVTPFLNTYCLPQD